MLDTAYRPTTKPHTKDYVGGLNRNTPFSMSGNDARAVCVCCVCVPYSASCWVVACCGGQRVVVVAAKHGGHANNIRGSCNKLTGYMACSDPLSGTG